VLRRPRYAVLVRFAGIIRTFVSLFDAAQYHAARRAGGMWHGRRSCLCSCATPGSASGQGSAVPAAALACMCGMEAEGMPAARPRRKDMFVNASRHE